MIKKIILFDCFLYKDLSIYNLNLNTLVKNHNDKELKKKYQYEFQYIDKLLIFLCIYLPKIIIIICLLIDISNNELNYFYKSFILIIISYLFKQLKFMLINFCEINIKELEIYINKDKFIREKTKELAEKGITVDEHHNEIYKLIELEKELNIEEQILESEEITKLELESFHNTLRTYGNYIILGNILNLLERFEIKCDKHELITNIIYYSLILIVLILKLIEYSTKIII